MPDASRRDITIAAVNSMLQPFFNIRLRIQNRCRRDASRLFGRRLAGLQLKTPMISFTFDDFPASALHVGGEILRRYGVRGTYYISMGLKDQEIPAGRAFSAEDIRRLVAEGHELGCHTFAHCHAWETKPRAFEESIVHNKHALEALMPGMLMRSLSYPIGCPRPQTKRLAARHFPCSRGGGQCHNVRWADLNCLSAFFLEQSRDQPDSIRAIIDRNGEDRGWLIFATHDVCLNPTRLGCTPALFEDIVRHGVNSGAQIATVGEAFDSIFMDQLDAQPKFGHDSCYT